MTPFGEYLGESPTFAQVLDDAGLVGYRWRLLGADSLAFTSVVKYGAGVIVLFGVCTPNLQIRIVDGVDAGGVVLYDGFTQSFWNRMETQFQTGLYIETYGGTYGPVLVVFQ